MFDTVAILAQGTSWAVADMQAFFLLKLLCVFIDRDKLIRSTIC